MIRDASGLTHKYPAMADETTGARLLPASGTALHREGLVLFGVELAPGDYEACVQAIDSGLEGRAPRVGQIKDARGIRRFLLRGIEAVRGEWRLICLTHNLLKLFRATSAPAA